jgi:outer membrane receptor protein involved in Fe transport
MRRQILWYLVSCTILFCARPLIVLGQTAQITGLVRDSTGGRVPDAVVTARNLATGIANTTTTNAAGNFTIPQLNPGGYSVTASKKGFNTVVRSPVIIDIAQVATVNFTLVVGNVTQKVTVSASTPLIETQTAAVGQVIGGTEVTNLPLNGRDFLQLATLTPGTLSSGAGFFLNNNTVRTNGMRASNTIYMINGINSTDQLFSGVTLEPAPDALEEFKVQSNTLDARYGLGGSVVNIEIKSGTNEFHGDAYDFLRNSALDARNFFAVTSPPLTQNQFGFTFGGPIKKNRTFFFGDYEGTRIREGLTFDSVVPTAAMRSGNFAGLSPITDPLTGTPFSGNVIPPGQISPQAAFFLKFIPLPNTSGGTYITSPVESNNVNQFDIRMDHQIKTTDSLKVTYSLERVSEYAPGAFPLNGGLTTDVHDQLAGLGWVHSFSPSIVNEADFGYTRTVFPGSEQGAGTNYTEEAAIGGFNLTSAEFPGFPGLSISGYTGLNGEAFRPIRIRENQWVLQDNLNIVRGDHSIEAGFDARWYAYDSYNAAFSRGQFNFTGAYTGNGFADFLLGYPYSGSRDFPRNLFGAFDRDQALYAQDNWKLKPRLTLNLGLRYALLHPMTALHNQMASVDPATNQIVVASASNGAINTNAQQVEALLLPLFSSKIVPSSKVGLPPSLRYTDYDYFDPRVGLAWEAPHSYVVRMGYAIAHSEEEGNRNVSEGIVNPPFIADALGVFNTVPAPSLTLANFFPPITPSQYTLGPLNFFQLDPNRPFPYFQQWNVTLQKVIGGVVSVEAGYVGSKGTHLPFSYLLNVPNPGPGVIQSRRAYPSWGPGTYIINADNNIYHALQTKAQIRAWRGLNLLATYTWSKGLDYQPQGTSETEYSAVQNPLCQFTCERGLDTLNLTNRFTLGGVYSVPFLRNRTDVLGQLLGGWRMTSIVTVQSGFPFTPTISTDPANTGTSMRPNRIGNGALPNPTINDWFNVAAFTVPAPYTFGNSGVNILTGPGLTDWDFGLFKDFSLSKLREGTRLEFRAEFFNFTNTPSFSAPDSDIQDPTAGKIFSTSDDPREIQFALKLYF